MKSKINIIITDDQKLFRDSLGSLLNGFNIATIGQAKNGNELLQLLETLTPDVILLDVEMQVMDGGAVLDILSKQKPHLKIIMLSQYDEHTLKENFLLRGAKSFLTKDDEIQTIVDEIRRIHELKSDYPCGSKHNFLFTKRELEIILMICSGKSSKEIALALNLDIKTIEAHRKNIYKKTGASSIGDFLKIAFKKGFHFLKSAIVYFFF